MRTAQQLNLNYDQILSLVKMLPIQQKISLTKELEKEGIDSKLSKLLKTFKTDKLSLKTISQEVEKVRQEMYDKR